VAQPIVLRPHYGVALGMGIIALGLGLWVLPLGVVALMFAFFLGYQTYSLRLVFQVTGLEVLQSGRVLRVFPYADWLTWRVFWPGFPVIFYFREVKSIHLIPVLFDSQQLISVLETYVVLDPDSSTVKR
jgi:Protein of unknown function (DUF3119)